MSFILLTKEEARGELKRLVATFKSNIDQYDKNTYIEDHTRKEFIDKFFRILGWDVYNDKEQLEQYKDVINEDAIKIGTTTKVPDYGFRIGGVRKFFVEAKKPSVNIKEESFPAYQLKRYAWNAQLPLSILTNFKELAIYDCTKKPSEKEKAEVNRVKCFSLDQYESNFDEIFDTFSYEAIFKGGFDKFIESAKDKRGTTTVDEEFLKEIEEWRDVLAKAIALRNKDLSISELNYAVQIIIDRILFLRICEDRTLEKYGMLQELITKDNIYKELLKYFEYADKKYNSGIFNLEQDKITTSISVDDGILKKIINELYYPLCPYEFNVIGVEILGQVYERFLGKVIRLTPSHQAKVEDKPEIKKSGGVFYTPQYIVEYIVDTTIGKLVKGKTPSQIEKIKILDPACGSGSFLIGAYSHLLEYHLKYYLKNDPTKFKKDVFQVKKNQWLLTSERKKKILLNNIYGVDIDAQAVEVTKLSLLLKVLEHETKESAYQQMKLVQERVLPDLDNNIKRGNSLIGREFYNNTQSTLINTQTKGVEIFDWMDNKKGFGEVMANGKFDVIIGNPPYIEIQKLKEFYPEETKFYQNYYDTAKEKNVDIYIPFIERSLSLLKAEGVLGFICPNRFFNSDYGKKLREHIKNFNLYHLVNFRHYFVFENADTYTCLLFLQKKKQQKNLIYKEIRDLYKNKKEKIKYYLNNCNESQEDLIFDDVEPHFLEQEKWYFMTEKETKIFERLSKLDKLSNCYEEFFVGVQTSQDNVYILKYISENIHDYILFSRALNKEVSLEKGIAKPIIDNTNIDFYNVIPPTEYVVFPYKVEGDTAKLYSQEELEKNYPNAWDYLLENKKVLENRENGKMRGNRWYAYIYPKNLTKQDKPKILIPHVIKKTKSAIDERGDYCLDNVGANGIILKEEIKESPKYFLAILNSPIATFFISKTSIFLSGGFYATNKQFAGEIPIKRINFDNKEEKEKYDKIVNLVSNIIEFKKKMNSIKLQTEQDTISMQIGAMESQVNHILYDLYKISDKEQKIIERC